jgi:sugar phosphate isomerase/epimerase
MKGDFMRLGGPIFRKYANAEEWVKAVKEKKYHAAYCPVGIDEKEFIIQEYAKAARENHILIAEVGAWSNPLSLDAKTRSEALTKCKKALSLAERIGANCAVNITGSRGEKWDGHDPKNLTEETFDMIVDYVRDIIDTVKPKTACYTLETMPWMYPDSADSYLKLIKAINRKNCAVHFDPVNLISSPQKYYDNAGLIKDFVKKLGKYIKSCHAKDIIMKQDLTTHLEETRPGTGNLDYKVYLSEISKLGKEIPVMLEHLSEEKDYDLAAGFIRRTYA